MALVIFDEVAIKCSVLKRSGNIIDFTN